MTKQSLGEVLKTLKIFKCLSTNYRHFHNIIKNASTGNRMGKQPWHSLVLAHVTQQSIFAFQRICFLKTCRNRKQTSATASFSGEGLSACSGQSGTTSNGQSTHCLHTGLFSSPYTTGVKRREWYCCYKAKCSRRAVAYYPGGVMTKGELQRRQQEKDKGFANWILQNT